MKGAAFKVRMHKQGKAPVQLERGQNGDMRLQVAGARIHVTDDDLQELRKLLRVADLTASLSELSPFLKVQP